MTLTLTSLPLHVLTYIFDILEKQRREAVITIQKYMRSFHPRVVFRHDQEQGLGQNPILAILGVRKMLANTRNYRQWDQVLAYLGWPSEGSRWSGSYVHKSPLLGDYRVH